MQALIRTPIQFLRLGGLLQYWVFSLLAATERAKARLWQNQTMKYGSPVRTHRRALFREGSACPHVLLLFRVAGLVGELCESSHMARIRSWHLVDIMHMSVSNELADLQHTQ